MLDEKFFTESDDFFRSFGKPLESSQQLFLTIGAIKPGIGEFGHTCFLYRNFLNPHFFCRKLHFLRARLESFMKLNLGQVDLYRDEQIKTNFSYDEKVHN